TESSLVMEGSLIEQNTVHVIVVALYQMLGNTPYIALNAEEMNDLTPFTTAMTLDLTQSQAAPVAFLMVSQCLMMRPGTVKFMNRLTMNAPMALILFQTQSHAAAVAFLIVSQCLMMRPIKVKFMNRLIMN